MKINKNLNVEPLFKNEKRRIYSLLEDSVVLVFERNNEGLKKAVKFFFF
jgi:hypothetical protein